MNIYSDILFSWIFFIFVLLWRCYVNKNKEFFENIPGPPNISFFKNLFNFSTPIDLLEKFSVYKATYGSVVKLQMGPWRNGLLISDNSVLEYIFSNTKLLKKCGDYQFLEPWLGKGLLTDDGEKWKAHRRVLNAAFQFEILEKFLDVFETCGRILTKNFEKEIGKGSVEISELIKLCSLDIIYESTVGVKINAQTGDNSEFVNNFKNMCKIISESLRSAIQKNQLLCYLTGNYIKQQNTVNILQEQINKAISDRTKKLENQENAITIVFNENENTKKKAFLDLLLEVRVDGQPLTQEEIKEEVNTLIFAGYDTMASALSFTLYCLANHKEIQKKVYNEQKSIFGVNNNSPIDYGHLLKMKYLDLVIKESLRLYPPVPIFCRETGPGLEYDNQKIPEGISLVIFTYGIHRDSNNFEDPDVFNPSRFENMDWTLPYSYIPFSAGPRNCIGQKFAMLAMKTVLSKIVRKFELVPAVPEHNLKLASDFFLTSTNGVKIGLKLR